MQRLGDAGPRGRACACLWHGVWQKLGGDDPRCRVAGGLRECSVGVLVHACNLSWGPPTTLLYFLLHRVIAPALYKGLHAAEARPIQKGGGRVGPDSRALWVELAEMLNIP